MIDHFEPDMCPGSWSLATCAGLFYNEPPIACQVAGGIMTENFLVQAHRHRKLYQVSMFLGLLAFACFLTAIVLLFFDGSWKVTILSFATSVFFVNAFGMNRTLSRLRLYQVWTDQPELLTEQERAVARQFARRHGDRLPENVSNGVSIGLFVVSILLLAIALFRIGGSLL